MRYLCRNNIWLRILAALALGTPLGTYVQVQEPERKAAADGKE